MKHRAKFLMFCENRRPAFYGTWRKSSVKVSPRNPFAIDQVITLNSIITALN